MIPASCMLSRPVTALAGVGDKTGERVSDRQAQGPACVVAKPSGIAVTCIALVLPAVTCLAQALYVIAAKVPQDTRRPTVSAVSRGMHLSVSASSCAAHGWLRGAGSREGLKCSDAYSGFAVSPHRKPRRVAPHWGSAPAPASYSISLFSVHSALEGFEVFKPEGDKVTHGIGARVALVWLVRVHPSDVRIKGV